MISDNECRVMEHKQFLEDVGKTHVEVEHMAGTLSRVKSVFNVVPDLVRKNERLERENAELTAELDDWKGNAEGFQPDAYMKLPLDADGVPIRIGDVVYGNPGVAWTVVGLCMSKLGWKVEMENVPIIYEPDDLTHKKPESADSWLQLSNDARMGAVTYVDRILGVDIRLTTTTEDYEAFASDIVRRAKKLAEMEEGERPDSLERIGGHVDARCALRAGCLGGLE